MIFKLAICDDEEVMLNSLKQKLETYFTNKQYQYQISTFLKTSDLISYAQSGNGSHCVFDILFLDIQMGDTSGIEVAKKLRKMGNDCHIIFVTVTKECVFEAFQLEASGYLIKPVDQNKLEETMDRVTKKICTDQLDALVVQKGKLCTSIKLKDILYCEVIERKVYIHTKKEVITFYNKFDDLEGELSGAFYRCHRSYIVNLKYVSSYQNDMAQLENGEQIPISRSKKHDFIQAVLKYMKGD